MGKSIKKTVEQSTEAQQEPKKEPNDYKQTEAQQEKINKIIYETEDEEETENRVFDYIHENAEDEEKEIILLNYYVENKENIKHQKEEDQKTKKIKEAEQKEKNQKKKDATQKAKQTKQEHKPPKEPKAEEETHTKKPSNRIKYLSYRRLKKETRNNLFNKDKNQHLKEYIIKAETKTQLKRRIRAILKAEEIENFNIYIYQNETRQELFNKTNEFKRVKAFNLTINSTKDEDGAEIKTLYEINAILSQEDREIIKGAMKQINAIINKSENYNLSKEENEQIKAIREKHKIIIRNRIKDLTAKSIKRHQSQLLKKGYTETK